MSGSNDPPAESAEALPGRLEVRLLGPFEVAMSGRTVHIGSPKQRAVLALLALQAGSVVSSDTLCNLVWEDDQPASPSATLQSLISRLRAALASVSGSRVQPDREVLRTREPGWVLDVDPAAVDALRFHELAVRARRRRERGDTAAAAAGLAEAMGLWRGAALVDIVEAGYLAAQATRLNEARLDALEDLADTELATGRVAEALARLEAHVEAQPLRERGWGLLMVALYRLGRQASALRAFQQARAILDDELGIEPSPGLTEIEQRILRHDPTLGAPPAPAQVAPRPPAPPPTIAATAGGEFSDYSVVVVEDHDFQRRTVVQLLRNLGVGTVRDASGGAEALQLLEGGAPDVIICDIDMPGMDGIEFVTRVAESNLACAIVIASGLETQVLRAVEAIGEGHGLRVLAALEKPLTARRLGEVLRQYTRVNGGGVHEVDLNGISGERLRRALESGDLTGQFTARIDLATGALSSAEVDGHWRDRNGVAIPPVQFVPVLADEGLLLPYVDRLIEASCGLLDAAADMGHTGLRVPFDVSLLSLAEVSLADRIVEMVQRRGQEPRRFVCGMHDIGLARARTSALSVLTRLRVKGFGLSMTHTGTGPSWPHALDRVPVSEVKLDRRVVHAATEDPKRFEMLESALAAARKMRLPVVADGCDSRAHFDAVVSLGCAEAQGRFIAEPMPAADLLGWSLAGYQPGESEAVRG
jgi:DNA-binding SARP family transcriptional activator/EAL domain-containing protein (putative c-di-GMP-specific phosphodiesterase class I)/CheY-like chemotaxis protein